MFAFSPFGITHVFTDNGLKFTNRLIKSKKENLCQKPSKIDAVCEENDPDHRLTKSSTSKTNGIVERANGTIKRATILKNNYNNRQKMITALNTFLIYYLIYRRHGGVRKELNVKTPFNTIEKWHELKTKIFIEKPINFKNKLLNLKQTNNSSFLKQPCES